MRRLFRRSALPVCVAACLLVLAGCGNSTSSLVKAGPIVAANTGTVTALAQGATLSLSMMPVGDVTNAGVDWTMTCGGNPISGSVTNGACGTFTPSHTADGVATVFTAPPVVPIGATLTITASVTSNPSQNTTLNVTIVALPIAVSIGTTVPVSLVTNGTITGLNARIANDPASAGVIWTATCSTAACGSFNPVITPATGANNGAVATTGATVYTAPPAIPGGGTVTITATSLTDTTKSASATIAIASPPPPPNASPIAVAISPATLYVATTSASRTVRLSATVANDNTAAGVDWTLSCSASDCGQITAHTASGANVSFTGPASVPSGGTVTITSTSTADNSKSSSAVASIITTTPIIVSLSGQPLPAALTTGLPATLAATVAPATGNLGVDWTATCDSAGACGSFNLSPAHTTSGGPIIYTAPATIPTGGVVTITASSSATTPSNTASATTTIVAKPPTIAFLQAPPTPLSSLAKAPISAVVTNDVPPGGVTWSVQCGSSIPGACGWIAPAQTPSGATATYTAPPVTSATTVTIVATSTSLPSASVSSTLITINPSTTHTVSFVPSAPSQVQANATINVAAAVANDATNAGVDWQVCASGCGFFTTRPAIAEIPATLTTPYVPAMPAVTATSVTAWPNNLPLSYTAPAQAPPSGSVVVLATAHADLSAANSATLTIGSASTGPALNGIVQAGSQPVTGASVALYATGTSGYGSAAAQVFASGSSSTNTTDANGKFTVPAGYICPNPGSQMYLLATGGKVGTHAANPNLVLMTALGSCSGLSSSSVVVNEATSVASAFAIAPFAANDALSGNSSYLYLGTSSTNGVGLANAFAAVNNLVDISTGQPRFTVPAGNASVPYVAINTLADILNACANSAGGVEGDGSACSQLFTYADVLPNHTLYNSTAPTDTLQAIFNIAQHPVTNYGYSLLSANSPFALITVSSPFQPTLAALPDDWSLSLNYTGGGGLSSKSAAGSLAIDATGNLWITDTSAGTVVEWNPLGAALSPSTGFPAGGGPIAIDAAGNIWISGNGALTELTNLGMPSPGSPFGGVAGEGSDMAFDAQSNLWIATGTGVAEFNSLGVALSPITGYANNGVTGTTAVSIDSANNVWIGDSAATAFAELTNPGGQLIVTPIPNGVGAVLSEIAADASGNIWAVKTNGTECELTPYAGKGTILMQACISGGGSGAGGGNITTYNFLNPRGIALDGAGTVWIASAGEPGNNVVAPNLLPIVPSLPTSSGNGVLKSPSLAAGPLRVAIDGSGNVWVLLANNTVTEYVGLATPVVAPLALGVKNKKLAAKP